MQLDKMNQNMRSPGFDNFEKSYSSPENWPVPEGEYLGRLFIESLTF